MVRISSFCTAVATLVVAATGSFASAVPQAKVPLEARTVYLPKITYPNASTVWAAGSHVHVSWNLTDLPSAALKGTGLIKLGHLDPASEGEHLAQTLAKNFPLRKGNVTFTLPKHLASRDDYIVVLFGDSGNTSPKFTIHQ